MFRLFRKWHAIAVLSISLLACQLPAEVQAHAFYLRLADDATGAFGWAGLGIDRGGLITELITHAMPMALAILASHLWLILAVWLLPRTWAVSAKALYAVLALGTASGCVIAGYISSPAIRGIVAYAAAALPLIALPLRLRVRASISEFTALHRLFFPSFLLALLIFGSDSICLRGTGRTGRQLPIDGRTCRLTRGCRSPSPRWFPLDAWTCQ
ncbi:hypothetical protein J7432_08730 [Xanthomonas axonopodis pv. begoniae]|nr:hypothetical protein [Xanthomonas axonopodis pv. begoniae]MBO9772776.1 hypothetical protein [Xanthomonas axonopodis pv. begoniae]